MRYTAMRNKVVTLLRESKQRFFDELNNADTKQFWRTMRILNRKSSSIPSLQDENNATIKSNTGKANALNSFFHRCFNYTFPSLIEFPDAFEMSLPPNECPKQLLSTEESVYDLLITLDTSKSTGCDGVSASVLKQTACSIALPLSKLINLSLSTGQVPYEWKLARITPIPKPGKDKNKTAGYRPISILPIASKIIEKHVKKVVLDHLTTYAPISPRQWGFMESRSTISALIKIIDDWSQALDQGREVCVIFFDVSKAFDKVPHLPLLQQMEEINLNPYLIRWFKDYLSDRHQVVAVEGEVSNKLPVVSGVPQGSILGPLLFIMYINNVITTISSGSEINMFADDIAVYRIITSTNDYAVLQEDISAITSFFNYKHRNFNEDKCRMML